MQLIAELEQCRAVNVEKLGIRRKATFAHNHESSQRKENHEAKEINNGDRKKIMDIDRK